MILNCVNMLCSQKQKWDIKVASKPQLWIPKDPHFAGLLFIFLNKPKILINTALFISQTYHCGGNQRGLYGLGMHVWQPMV